MARTPTRGDSTEQGGLGAGVLNSSRQLGSALEFGGVHRRLRDHAASVLDCGDSFVHLLGAIDVDAEAAPAHTLRGCSRFRLAVGGQLVPREQRQ